MKNREQFTHPSSSTPHASANRSERATEDLSLEERMTHEKLVKKKRSMKWFALWLIIVVIGIGGGVGWYLFGNKEVKLTPQFNSAVHHYDEVDAFSEGMAAVRKGKRWGYINMRGEEVIPCQYRLHVGRFSEGVACVPSKVSQKVEFINKEGKVVLNGDFAYSPQFSDSTADHSLKLPYFEQGACMVFDLAQKQSFFINHNGEKVERPEYEVQAYRSPKKDDIVTFEQNGLYGLKYGSGDIIVPAKYASIGEFRNGVALATLSVDVLQQNAKPHALPTFSVQRKTLYGYVDKKGRETFYRSDYARIDKMKRDNARIRQQIAEERKAEQQRLEREQSLKAQGPAWLQGEWTITLPSANGESLQVARIIIGGDQIEVQEPGQTYKGDFVYDEGRITWGDGESCELDTYGNRIRYRGGGYYTKVLTDEAVSPQTAAEQ